MKHFLRANAAFLIIAFTLTGLSLLKVSNAHAQGDAVKTLVCYATENNKLAENPDIKGIDLWLTDSEAHLRINTKEGKEHNFEMTRTKYDVLNLKAGKTHAVLYANQNDDVRWVMGNTKNVEFYSASLLVKDKAGEFTLAQGFACVYKDIVKRRL